jgi:hypothetical protein
VVVALLAEERVGGALGEQQPADELLRARVHDGDDVGRRGLRGGRLDQARTLVDHEASGRHGDPGGQLFQGGQIGSLGHVRCHQSLPHRAGRA